MFNGGHIVQQETGKTLDSTTRTYEMNQSEYTDNVEFTVILTAPSSLVGGALFIEEFDAAANAWQKTIQQVAMLASGGGNPAGVHENTASGNLITGSVVTNTTGVTAISNTGTFVLRSYGNGKKKRLNTAASSGTATLAYACVGKQTFTR